MENECRCTSCGAITAREDLVEFDDEYLCHASTEQILRRALTLLPFSLGEHEDIQLFSGDMLCIDAKGKRAFPISPAIRLTSAKSLRKRWKR